MKKIILFSFLFLTAVLLYSTPKIDCNGNTPDCQLSSWENAQSYVFKLNDCWASVSFSVKSCCTSGSFCEYIFDIQQIRTIGQCGLTDDVIKTEALKFAITKAYDMLNIPPFMMKTFHVRIPKCQGNASTNDDIKSKVFLIEKNEKITILRTVLHSRLIDYIEDYSNELTQNESNRLRRFFARKLDHLYETIKDKDVYDWWKDN